MTVLFNTACIFKIIFHYSLETQLKHEIMVKQARQSNIVSCKGLKHYTCFVIKITVTCVSCKSTVDSEVCELYMKLQATSHHKVSNH